MITKTEIGLIVLAFLAVIIGTSTWKLTKDHYVAQYEARIAKEKIETDKRIIDLTNQKLETERKLGELRNELDKEYNKTIKDLNTRVDDLKRDNVRLRDPGAKSGGSCTATDSKSTSGDSGALAESGLLSKQASEFLLDFAGESDRTLEQLRVCRAWVDNVQKTMNEYSAKQEKDSKSRRKTK